MKATLDTMGVKEVRSVKICLEPENEREREMLLELAKLTSRTCIVNHRGFEYMSPVTGFVVQPMPSRD